MKYTFEGLKEGYTKILDSVKITNPTVVNAEVKRIIANKERYLKVSTKTKIPWYLIAGIHSKEASLKFDRYLGNGQKLTQKTTIVPKGRGPFKSWEDGAIDAFNLQKHILSTIDITDGWSLEECCWYVENFNGLGYRSKGINSPYLWACTSAYTKGGYVSDGKYSPNAVIKNPGVMALISGIKQSQGYLDDINVGVKLTAEEKHDLFLDEIA